MNYEFYSISDRKKISAKVTEKVVHERGNRKSYMLKALSPEGKKLNAIVSKETYDDIVVE